MPWVSVADIAEAVAQRLSLSFDGSLLGELGRYLNWLLGGPKGAC